jgi:hypothetical protein
MALTGGRPRPTAMLCGCSILCGRQAGHLLLVAASLPSLRAPLCSRPHRLHRRRAALAWCGYLSFVWRPPRPRCPRARACRIVARCDRLRPLPEQRCPSRHTPLCQSVISSVGQLWATSEPAPPRHATPGAQPRVRSVAWVSVATADGENRARVAGGQRAARWSASLLHRAVGACRRNLRAIRQARAPLWSVWPARMSPSSVYKTRARSSCRSVSVSRWAGIAALRAGRVTRAPRSPLPRAAVQGAPRPRVREGAQVCRRERARGRDRAGCRHVRAGLKRGARSEGGGESSRGESIAPGAVSDAGAADRPPATLYPRTPNGATVACAVTSIDTTRA